MRKMPRSKVFGVFEKCSLHKIKQIWGFARGECLASGWGKGLEKGEVLSLFGEICAKFSEFSQKFSKTAPKKVLCHYRTWKQYER